MKPNNSDFIYPVFTPILFDLFRFFEYQLARLQGIGGIGILLRCLPRWKIQLVAVILKSSIEKA